MESIKLVCAETRRKGGSDRQNWNISVYCQKIMGCGGEWGEWAKIMLWLELKQIYKQGTLAKMKS